MVQTAQSSYIICGVLQELSHALSASKKYRLAADINEHLRNVYASSSASKTESIDSYLRQGVALVRDNDLDRAEEMFLKGLAEHVAMHNDVAVIHELFGCFVEHLMGLYKLKMFAGRDKHEAATSVKFHATLTAILIVAGLRSSKDDIQLSWLKRHLRKAKAAKKAVLDAFRLGSVGTFRETVLSWSAGNHNLIVPDLSHNQRIFADSLKKSAKSFARSALRSHYDVDTPLPCSNPGCKVVEVDQERLSRCSKCKTTLYCSRECQIAHWKVHKKTCNNNGA